jgi:hypothetical protein
MNWYVACLLISPSTGGGARRTAQQCQYLIEASTHDEAYDRALELGHRITAGRFVGVADLVLMHDRPAEGVELLWSECEMAASKIGSLLLRREEMRAFREKPSTSGWYVGSVILQEVHDEGSHGSLSLVWTNTYLVRAASPEEAYEGVARIGMGQQDEPGSHRCDGDKAHWEFRGTHQIISVREVPAPDALLWCDEVGAADPPEAAIPEKPHLTVFRWEAGHAHRAG